MIGRMVGIAILSGAALAGGLAVGCGSSGDGSSDDGPVCGETFTPCGGDPVGTWQVEMCGSVVARFSFQAFEPTCHGLPFTIEQDATTGTITYDADGTGHFDYQVADRYSFTAPATCVAAMAGDRDPAELCRSLIDQFVNHGWTGGACTPGDDGGCHCALVGEAHQQAELEWQVSGTVMSFPQGGLSYDFCVDGDRMYRHALPAEAYETTDVWQVLTRVE